MKRLLFFLVIAMTSMIAVSAAGDNGCPIEFAVTNHDFGNIHASKGAVSYEYEFTNSSSEPVAIISVTNGGCGCTTPSFPKKPIAPGKKGVIKITFNPQGRSGEFNREVKVRYAASQKKGRLALRFSGVVIP